MRHSFAQSTSLPTWFEKLDDWDGFHVHFPLAPYISSGTLAITLATQLANTLFAGPTTGSAAAPTFRAMVLADIPDGLVTLTKLNQSSCSTNDSIKWNGSAWVCLTGGASPLTTKGDLFGFSTVNARVAVGTDGQYLMADSSAATGVSWQTVAPGSGASASATYVTTASEAGLSAETTIGTIISTNAYASLPSAAVSGKLFFSNNSPYVLRDTGAAWAVWGPVFPLTIPNDAAFSWVNQGTATTTTTDGTVAFFVPKSTGTVLRGRVKTAPATPYTITAAFFPNWVYMNSGEHIGLIFRESGTSKMAQCETWVSATSPFASAVSGKFTNNTTYSADYVSRGNFVGNILWLQIGDDGTNRTCKISSDGKNWINLHSVARLDFLTGGADQVGWFAEEQTNTYDFTPVLLSWKEQ